MSQRAFRVIETLRFCVDDVEAWGLMSQVKSTRKALGTAEDMASPGHVIAYLYADAEQASYYYELRGMRPSAVLSLDVPMHRDAVAVLIWNLD